MTKETILIISSIIASPFLAGIVTGLYTKKKTGAETQNINIGGEISIGDYGMRIAKKWEEDFERLNKKFDDLNDRFDIMKQEKEEAIAENKKKDKKIKDLEARIDVLEEEAKKYKDMASTIQTAAHTAVDDIALKVASGEISN